MDFVADGGFLLILHIGFRKFWWISIFRPTAHETPLQRVSLKHDGPAGRTTGQTEWRATGHPHTHACDACGERLARRPR